MGGAYKGETPMVRCREVSGANCDRWMPLDAEHCGNSEHVRLRWDTKPSAEAEYVSRPGGRPSVRRPTLTVDEDFDLMTPGRNMEADRRAPDLDPETFDASDLWVGIKVQKAFTAHHGTDANTAISELRLLAAEALAKGKYERQEDGFHRLRYKEFTLTLSPDGKAVTRYATFHYERTPSEVLTGKRSRFRKGGGMKREPGPPRPLPELVESFDPGTVGIAETALRLYAKRMGFDSSDQSTEAAMRLELGEAAVTGTWRKSDRGPTAYVLETPSRHWVIASDDGTIITHYQPETVD
jgi:hypothetical protein